MRRALPLRIFVIESHVDTAKWLRIYLEDSGCTVTSVATLAEARQLFPDSMSDVLLADIGMAASLGWDILEKFGQSRSVFAIAFSGYGFRADVCRSQLAGFRAHLLKPFQPGELDRLLNQAAEELRVQTNDL